MHTCKYKHKHTCMYEHTYIYTHAHNLWEQASKGGSRFTMRSEPESRFTVQFLCCLGQMAQSLCLHSFLRHCIPELLEHLRERGFYGQCACRPGDRRQHFQSGDRQSLLLGKQSEANKEGILNQKNQGMQWAGDVPQGDQSPWADPSWQAVPI